MFFLDANSAKLQAKLETQRTHYSHKVVTSVKHKPDSTTVNGYTVVSA